MGQELDVDFYDNSYKKNKLYSLHCRGDQTSYKDMFNEVLNNLNNDDKILELGCGSGQLAEMIIDKGFNYIQGIDFSSESINIARQRCDADFFICDLNDYRFYVEYNCIVATEVFEHITNDLQIIERLNSGVKVIFSVPNYDYKSHVRFFETEKELIDRYSKYFSSYKITKVGRIYVLIGIKI